MFQINLSCFLFGIYFELIVYYTLPEKGFSYTMFKSPISINESDTGRATFAHNRHLFRQTMHYPLAHMRVYSKTKDFTSK